MSRDPRDVGSSLRRVVGGLSGGGGSGIVAVLGCWDEVVGEGVGAHARPRRLSNGVLGVDVDEPGWATQLRYLRSQMIEQINTRLGNDVVQSIELRVKRS
jgi:predicted nucleic acid-binding Zn ribbon protein